MSEAAKKQIVNPDNFAVPYAVSDEGQLFQIKDGKPVCEDLRCPLCKSNVFFIKETDRAAAHFRHNDRTNCDALAKYHRETLHNHVRDAAAALLNGRTKARDLCKASAGIALPTGFCHTEKEHEYGGKRYRPDLTVDPAPGDRAPTLELEIIWSSKPTDARLEAASRAGRLIGILRIDDLERSYYDKLHNNEAFDIPEACREFVKRQKFTILSNAKVNQILRGLLARIYMEATVAPEHAGHRLSRVGRSAPKPVRTPMFCGACGQWETPGDPCVHIREILAWSEQ